jgi:hypothetical protein
MRGRKPNIAEGWPAGKETKYIYEPFKFDKNSTMSFQQNHDMLHDFVKLTVYSNIH